MHWVIVYLTLMVYFLIRGWFEEIFNPGSWISWVYAALGVAFAILTLVHGWKLDDEQKRLRERGYSVTYEGPYHAFPGADLQDSRWRENEYKPRDLDGNFNKFDSAYMTLEKVIRWLESNDPAGPNKLFTTSMDDLTKDFKSMVTLMRQDIPIEMPISNPSVGTLSEVLRGFDANESVSIGCTHDGPGVISLDISTKTVLQEDWM